MPLIPILIIGTGLLALAFWRRSKGPIELAPDEGLFGRGTGAPVTRDDQIAGIATRIVQGGQALRVKLFGQADLALTDVASRIRAASRAQLMTWAQDAAHTGAADDQEVSQLLTRLASEAA